MICNKCKKELPDESEFCPYCMTKFTAEQPQSEIKKGNNKAMIIVAAVLAVLVVILAVVLVSYGIKKKPADKAEEKASVSDSAPASENVTKTEAPTSEPSSEAPSYEQPSKEEIKNEYHLALSAYLSDQFISDYFLYDMNSDGIPELIIDYGYSYADREYHFCTFHKGQFKIVGSLSAGHGALYAPKSGDGIMSFGGHMGSYSVELFTLDGVKLSSETIKTGALSPEQDYEEISAKYCGDQLIPTPISDIDYLMDVFE